jgi:putative SOS response-associated peptidase YedK
MCGRIALHSKPSRLARIFEARLAARVREDELPPSWNVGPTREIVGVAEDREHHRVLDLYRWGLVPSWAKDLSVGNRSFNAKAETLARRPLFRKAFASRRLIVPADSFYEWEKQAGRRRQPHLFRRVDGHPLAFAGLWEPWRDPNLSDDPDAWMRSCTIITTAAGPDVADIHDRMPVVLEPDGWERWIDRDFHDLDELSALLRPSFAGTLERYPVDARVGNVANDDPTLVVPLVSGSATEERVDQDLDGRLPFWS